MLVSHHAALSALAAAAAAPLVKNPIKLGLFWAAAVGQDVDHYLWYAVAFRNPSLPDAYRYFRSRFGRVKGPVSANTRAFHGPAPLAGAVVAGLIDRRLAPIALGMAFHGLLDAFYEWVIMPRQVERRPKVEPLPARRPEPVLAGERAA